MRLNVYLISHPIIQKISTQARYSVDFHNSITYNYHIFQQLHTLLIYEVLRKWIIAYKVYIKHIGFTKELYTYDIKESYVIITNLINCSNILPNINYMLPKVYIQHLNFNQNIINDYHFNHDIIPIIHNNKIIIMDNFLKQSIIKLLDYLIVQKEVPIAQIKIICITCTNKTLETIADKYPLISIYITQIEYS